LAAGGFAAWQQATFQALLAMHFVGKPLFWTLGSWTMLDVSRLGGGQVFELCYSRAFRGEAALFEPWQLDVSRLGGGQAFEPC